MVTVNDIHKSFSDRKVLKGVSFEVGEGCIYGLIGKNGAGKTTLMRIMTDLLAADSGNVEYRGDGTSNVAYLPDLPAFYEYLTTDEYLDFLLVGRNPARRDELLKTVGLKPGLRIKTLSRGMRQRLGIASVLVNDPDVILLDEPTSALDPAGRSEVKDILLKLKNEGKTIILSTHILADMDSICDRAGFLHNGVIAREVDVKENRDTTKGLSVRFATTPDLTVIQNNGLIPETVDEFTLRFELAADDRLKSQQKILATLALIPQEIVSIGSADKTLDMIFTEVCI